MPTHEPMSSTASSVHAGSCALDLRVHHDWSDSYAYI
jgi:hypothetical protein